MIWIIFCKTADIDRFLVYFFTCIINCLYNLHKHIAMHTNFTNDTMIFSKFLTLRWKDMMIISFHRVIYSHMCLALQWKWAFVANLYKYNQIQFMKWQNMRVNYCQINNKKTYCYAAKAMGFVNLDVYWKRLCHVRFLKNYSG